MFFSSGDSLAAIRTWSGVPAVYPPGDIVLSIQKSGFHVWDICSRLSGEERETHPGCLLRKQVQPYIYLSFSFLYFPFLYFGDFRGNLQGFRGNLLRFFPRKLQKRQVSHEYRQKRLFCRLHQAASTRRQFLFRRAFRIREGSAAGYPRLSVRRTSGKPLRQTRNVPDTLAALRLCKRDFLSNLLPLSGNHPCPTLESIHLLHRLCKTHTARTTHWMHQTPPSGALPFYPSETQHPAESIPILFLSGVPEISLLYPVSSCFLHPVRLDFLLSSQNEKMNSILQYSPIVLYNGSICLWMLQR